MLIRTLALRSSGPGGAGLPVRNRSEDQPAILPAVPVAHLTPRAPLLTQDYTTDIKALRNVEIRSPEPSFPLTFLTMKQLPENLLAPPQSRRVAGAAEMAALELRPPAAQPDGTIRQAVLDALGRDLLVWSFDFNVNVRHGRVYLYGRVNSRAERARVAEVVSQIEGVVGVDNQVDESGQEEPATQMPMFQSAPPPRSLLPSSPDQALADRIRQRHFWSPALHHQRVEVRVQRGQVTLTGTVTTWLDREEAGLDAYEAGARDVRNCLAVRVDLDARPGAAPHSSNYPMRRAG